MKTHRRVLLAVLAGIVLVALPALADEAQRNGRCDDPRFVARFLQLTETQVAEWRELRADLRAATKPLHDAIGPLQDQLETLLDGAAPDACTDGAVVVSIDDNRDQLAALRADYESDFEALLTAEQLDRWERLQGICRGPDRP